MGYASLAHCVKDLEQVGALKRIEVPLDPNLEVSALQRLVFKAKGPALLLTQVKDCPFPILTNLFGTKERLHYLFRNELPVLEDLFKLSDPGLTSKPWKFLKRLSQHCLDFLHLRPRYFKPSQAALFKETCNLEDLPKIKSWPLDGGPFITLPLVYSEDPLNPGPSQANLGMYRIQLSGGEYEPHEVGLHYQIHRGLGVHHARALAKGVPLQVHIYVGGPPALILAAVMPMPEGLSELKFAGLLGGEGVALSYLEGDSLPYLAECDFCLKGYILPRTKPEGPFGDHVGYYSLAHPFPVVKVEKVYHRPFAIWPCTSVGRPPQEDTILGEFIHEITGPLVPKVFRGVSEVHAVDAAGVHPLLLALGEERYTPYEARRKPREILTQALHLLGTTQTALAKYLLILAREDVPSLSTREVLAFFKQILKRTDFKRDLHFLTCVPNDTLDYTGGALHEGSKLIWAAAGEERRNLGSDLGDLTLLAGVTHPQIVEAGIMTLEAPKHTLKAGEVDPKIIELSQTLASWTKREEFPLVVVADDADFVAKNWSNFLWTTFTKSDPSTDIYGVKSEFLGKHFGCEPPLIIDARSKSFHAPSLEEDPKVIARLLDLAAKGGPLYGCI